MSHIFISYSRQDINFAQKIVDALAEINLDTWIDWKSIPKGEDWEQEIYRGIEEADAFLFLISPDSVASEMCNKEIAHTVKNNKRVIPIVIRDADIKHFLHEISRNEISRRNWIFCRDGLDNFDKAIEGTRETIHTDYEWLKYHTELQVNALKWERKKDASWLLRGQELQEAEQKLATTDNRKDPQPTVFQRQYVLASRKDEDEQLFRTKEELRIAYDATIEGWAQALDLRDRETEGHAQRVTELTLRLAHTMGVSESELVNIRRGAVLHDIGKMGIPDGILHKPANLTDEEWEIMRKHPQFAYDMLRPIAYLGPALDIPYCHHEKWDGTGYPRGLKGEQIPLGARIFAVVDVYVTLGSDRPYRPAWSEQDILDYIQAQSGKHFDQEIVKAFLRMVSD
jgi:HD-GYP domain-containing protein (c-di-GMP phosphodiesterase class II)